MSDEHMSLEELIVFAKAREEEAADFYFYLADLVKDPDVSGEAIKMAREEEQHRKELCTLLTRLDQKVSVPVEEDLTLSVNWMTVPEVDENLSFQELIVVGMKREALAFRLYTQMAAVASPISEALTQLAARERAHLTFFEDIYDNRFNPEN